MSGAKPSVVPIVGGGGGGGGGAGGGGGGGGGGAAVGGGKVVAGSGSRIAWLLREGVGHTASMGIRGTVRPATRPMDTAQLRKALASLFAQQRALSAQSAVGNWELLGAMVLLQPKQRHLQSVHDALVHEANEAAARGGPAGETRAALVQRQLARVAELSAEREAQRKWCCEVWQLRRHAVGAVSSRLTSQTLFALMKLTDAANVHPAGWTHAPPPVPQPPPLTSRARRAGIASALTPEAPRPRPGTAPTHYPPSQHLRPRTTGPSPAAAAAPPLELNSTHTPSQRAVLNQRARQIAGQPVVLVRNRQADQSPRALV